MNSLARCPAMPPDDSSLEQCELSKYHDGLHLSHGKSFDSEKFPADMVTQCRYCTPTNRGTHHADCPRLGKGEVNQMPKATKEPSPEVKAAAEALLAGPTAMGLMNEELKKLAAVTHKIAGTLEGLVAVLLERKKEGLPLFPAVAPVIPIKKAKEETKHVAKPKERSSSKSTKESRSAAAFAAAETRRLRASSAGRS